MTSTTGFDVRRRRIVLLPASVAAVGLLGACSTGRPNAATTGSDIVAATPTPSSTSGPTSSVPAGTPSAPAASVAPVKPVSVTSSVDKEVAAQVPFAAPLHVALWGGSQTASLASVVLHGPAGVPAGAFDAARRRWTVPSLVPDASYTLVAVAKDGSTATTFRRKFTTAKADKTLSATIFPSDSATYGVGIPVIVTFDHDVVDKAAVERALKVSTSSKVVGSWHWDSDDTVSYRPKTYWPANSRVSVQADLDGVDTGDGRWGTATSSAHFSIGNSVINKVDLAADELTVLLNGRVARVIPVTGGQYGMHTRSGTSVISQKYADIQMDSESVGYQKGSANYYNLMVHWAMRITNSGEFLHAAPWSVYAQGHENVSHGCVGMSTSNAYWLYEMTNIGDVVVVSGTDRPLEQGNGWTDWNMSWSEWLKGSALHGTAT